MKVCMSSEYTYYFVGYRFETCFVTHVLNLFITFIYTISFYKHIYTKRRPEVIIIFFPFNYMLRVSFLNFLKRTIYMYDKVIMHARTCLITMRHN